MTGDEPLLTVSSVTVRRGGREILSDVSFTARRNEVLGVIGPNGAGKTTLLETIAGFTSHQSGTIASNGSLFYLPDGIRPWPQQRVDWLLRFFTREPVRSDIIDALQLRSLLAQKIGSLSKGEAKRVLLALALSTPHAVLLLDEPFDGLDFRQTRRATELLRSTASTRSLVVSIHQLSDAERVCDRFLLLDHGRGIAEGTLDELQQRAGGNAAALEEVFLALE